MRPLPPTPKKKMSRSSWIRISFLIAASHRVAVICVHSNSGDQGTMSRSERRVPAPLHFTQRADAGALFFHTSSNYNKELLEVIENRTEGTRRSEGSGSQSDRANTSLRGARVAVGTRRHITSEGPGSPTPTPPRQPLPPRGGKRRGASFRGALCYNQ